MTANGMGSLIDLTGLTDEEYVVEVANVALAAASADGVHGDIRTGPAIVGLCIAIAQIWIDANPHLSSEQTDAIAEKCRAQIAETIQDLKLRAPPEKATPEAARLH